MVKRLYADNELSFLRQTIVVKCDIRVIFVETICPEFLAVTGFMRTETGMRHPVRIDFYVSILPWLGCQGSSSDVAVTLRWVSVT